MAARRSAYSRPKLFFYVRSREVLYKIRVTDKRKEIQTKKKTKEMKGNEIKMRRGGWETKKSTQKIQAMVLRVLRQETRMSQLTCA
jgi:hypothetical protein